MLLKFHAKPGALCPWPNSHFAGQPRRYIGRRFVAPNAETKAPAAYPANDEPDAVDANDADAPAIIRYCRKGNVWPADVATAAVCGIDFVALAKDAEGEWLAASKPATPAAKPAVKKD